MTISNLVGNTYLERGSPSTLFYVDSEIIYIIDPGQGDDRPRQLRRDLEKLPKKEVAVFLTHYHSDHLSALEKLQEVKSIAISSVDAPMARTPELRVAMTFTYPLNPQDSILSFHGPAVGVTDELPVTSNRYGPLTLVPLPGHTDGQMGVMTPDGVLYAGDSLFGDRVLSKYGVPYHRVPCMALESLKRLEDLASKAELIVPSHGPVVRAGDAVGLIEANMQRISDAMSALEEALQRPSGTSELVSILLKKYRPEELSADVIMLLEATVKGYIRCLREGGKVEALASDAGIAWKLKAASP